MKKVGKESFEHLKVVLCCRFCSYDCGKNCTVRLHSALSANHHYHTILNHQTRILVNALKTKMMCFTNIFQPSVSFLNSLKYREIVRICLSKSQLNYVMLLYSRSITLNCLSLSTQTMRAINYVVVRSHRKHTYH